MEKEQSNGWSRRRVKKAARLARIARWMNGCVLETGGGVGGHPLSGTRFSSLAAARPSTLLFAGS